MLDSRTLSCPTARFAIRNEILSIRRLDGLLYSHMSREHAKRALLSAVALLAPLCLAAQSLLLIKPPPTDPNLLQGSWDGTGPGGKCAVTISGNSLIYTQPSSADTDEPFRYATEFVVAPDTYPPQVHATILSDRDEEQPHAGTVVVVIFMIENGTLKLGVINSFETPPSDPVTGDWDSVQDLYKLSRSDAQTSRSDQPHSKASISP